MTNYAGMPGCMIVASDLIVDVVAGLQQSTPYWWIGIIDYSMKISQSSTILKATDSSLKCNHAVTLESPPHV
jgi:hypothetical protein